ncbi:MAG: helix-turn-helix domain-containing protein [Mycobacterium sp.]
MDGFMSGPEVARYLGVSERRVRAMIAAGQLPAERLMGRWVIPAEVAASHRSNSAGRPLSEVSAWRVLTCLGSDGDGPRLPSRLRNRIRSLCMEDDPRWRLRSWLSARGKPVRLWGFTPALNGLADDERVVVSGDSLFSELEPSGQARFYAPVGDLDAVIGRYGLRMTENGSRLPNALIWAVSDLDAVPRDPGNDHAVAELVSAIDLLDSGDPRAVGVASRVVERALERWHEL